MLSFFSKYRCLIIASPAAAKKTQKQERSNISRLFSAAMQARQQQQKSARNANENGHHFPWQIKNGKMWQSI
ncbi:MULTISPECIES: hypothetical protein [unclassified Janthinobacterium]|uniref:hypothetical protein n=1 Tax=unclassified Janthinobacterium TaxID=2610881 RepID=UPI00271282DD|nr:MULTISPECIES: hypothetical protein [unclassified Janthinobacterium]MDO8068856.1 hypothetical protein [Janthinobacterium sp. SUN206]MDO8073617.1 hypothetical protein [Janthinobacterium sp. SUN176]